MLSLSPVCPECKNVITEWNPGPVWNPELVAAICAECENRMLHEAEIKQLERNIHAAARAGRFDLI